MRYTMIVLIGFSIVTLIYTIYAFARFIHDDFDVDNIVERKQFEEDTLFRLKMVTILYFICCALAIIDDIVYWGYLFTL